MNIKAIVNTMQLILLTSVCLLLFSEGHAQPGDSTRTAKHFGGSIAATNNGISLLPTFSLNKPAGLAVMNMGKRFTFDPEFRFALDGKPWSFIFWWRYKLVQKGRFHVTVGAHPGFLFRRSNALTSSGTTVNIITTERYLAAEVVRISLLQKIQA